MTCLIYSTPKLLAGRPGAAVATRRHVAARQRQPRYFCAASSSAGAAAPPPESGNDAAPQPPAPQGGVVGWFAAQQAKTAALQKKLASLGLAAVLSYGMFDGLSYTVAFVIAFLGYEAQTGLNPTQNVADLVKICILMWAGNNVTRPFRLAAAAALAPFMDKVMDRMREKLRLPNKFAAFAIIVALVASTCFLILGALFLSRLAAG